MTARPIFYDTETTGLKAEKDRIIEIAAYDPVQDRSFVKLINPGVPIPSEVSAIHHITDKMVADAPGFDQIGKEFIEFCDGDVILVAHNNDSFDVHFLRCEFERMQTVFPSTWRFVDSLKWARRYRPDLPRHTLQFLREIYKIEANNAHRALDDVIVLHKVFANMVDDLSIDSIYHLLNKPKPLLHMPFGKHQGVPLKDVPRDYVSWMARSGSFDKPENKDLRTGFEKLGYI